MALTDNVMNGLRLLQAMPSKYKDEFVWGPVLGFSLPVLPEFVYRLTYRGFEPLYEMEDWMPDVNFYDNLKYQAGKVRECLIALDQCMTNLTGLMEQAAHLQTSLEDVPAPPLPPPYVDAGTDFQTPAIPPPASTLFSPPYVDARTAAPAPDVTVSSHIQYDTVIPAPSHGTISYE